MSSTSPLIIRSHSATMLGIVPPLPGDVGRLARDRHRVQWAPGCSSPVYSEPGHHK
jgi:hypothetical protein